MTSTLPRWLRLSIRGPRVAAQLARWGVPARALVFGPLSLGDDLLCTTVLREARLRNRPFVMMTSRPELFRGNTDPSRIIPVDPYHIQTLRRLGTQVVQPYYQSADPIIPERDVVTDIPILAEMCRIAGISGKIGLRPYLHLTEREREHGARFRQQIAIQSSAAAAAVPFANKEWGAARFAEVCRLLSSRFKLVQLGSPADPALPVDLDLRGQTTLREAAAVLANSQGFIGLEGFLTHLARAVDCPSVVIFGGRIHPRSIGYVSNRNLYTSIACSPCGLRDTCAYERACMSEIKPAAVALAASELFETSRRPLEVESFLLP